MILIEACEESGSFDLPFYVDHLLSRIGTPSLVICLDSGCGNYEQLWGTTSLRGIAAGELTVEVLREGVHSGDASGIVPSSFRILRHLLSRIEDPETGRLVDEFHVKLPKQRVDQARAAAEVLGDAVSSKFPWLPGMQADARRPHRARAQPHLAADALGHGRRRHPAARERRQRAAPEDRGQALRCACRRRSTRRRPRAS